MKQIVILNKIIKNKTEILKNYEMDFYNENYRLLGEGIYLKENNISCDVLFFLLPKEIHMIWIR